MRYVDERIVFQEVPDETSYCFTISGCQLRCDGCHMSSTWDSRHGITLTKELLESRLEQYQPYISCVVFMGGDWDSDLRLFLELVKRRGVKTCLYTGLEDVNDDIKQQLDYLKTGPWIKELGGLDSPRTNQHFIHVPSNTDITYKFIKQ